MNAEPFDPTPETDEQIAANYVAQGCERFRKAIALLENTDPELARRLFEIHKSGTEVLHGMRS